MKIVKLTAENIKRLRAVEITPDGSTVVISGRNGQGKTSVLDAIWFALGGGPAAKDTTRPIRDGQDSAQVTVDLGDLRVTRTWKADKTTLKVEAADGATYKSPQSMLDGLVGRMSFDPLAFAQQDNRTQLATLLDLIDLPFDLDDLETERAALYGKRTEVGRTGKTLVGQLAGMAEPPADLPAAEVSTADLLAEYRQAQRAHQRYDDLAGQVYRWQAEVARLQKALKAASVSLSEVEESLADTPAPPALDAIEQRISGAEDTNRQVRAAAQRTQVAEQVARTRAEYERLTAEIDKLDTVKATAIRKAAMPIDGLAFDDSGVTYQGIPFKQCSAAEQLRVSVAMAMALNPKVRVIRITDGSLLDSDNMRLIEEMAAEQDYQCWVERVSDSKGIGIHIEDGSVVSS